MQKLLIKTPNPEQAMQCKSYSHTPNPEQALHVIPFEESAAANRTHDNDEYSLDPTPHQPPR